MVATPLGRLLAVHWSFGGDPGVPICSRSRGRPRCSPHYGARAAMPAAGGDPGVLVLWGLRDPDAGTYRCLLLGQDDCACGEVTLRLGPGELRREPLTPASGLRGRCEPLTPVSGLQGLQGW